MPEERYSIVYKGEVLPGSAPDLVKTAFAQKFRIAGGALESLFSGKPVVLKKDLDREAAEKYFKVLSSIGAKCSVRRTAPPSDGQARQLLTPPPAEAVARPAPLPPRPIEPPPAAQRIACPKCGAIQDDSVECARCGIVFAHYLNATPQKQSAKTRAVIEAAQKKVKEGDSEAATAILDAHLEQHGEDWVAHREAADVWLNHRNGIKGWLKKAKEHLEAARTHGGELDPQVLALSAEAFLATHEKTEATEYALRSVAAYRTQLESVRSAEERKEIAKRMDALAEKFTLGANWTVYDGNDRRLVETGDSQEIARRLRDGRIPGDATAEVNGNTIRLPLYKALKGANWGVDLMLRPAHMIGLIGAGLLAVVGVIWFFPMGFSWGADFFGGCIQWYFENVTSFALIVLFFIPYFKPALACAILLGFVPLMFGGALFAIPGYMAGYVLGFLLSPVLPKPKLRRTS